MGVSGTVRAFSELSKPAARATKSFQGAAIGTGFVAVAAYSYVFLTKFAEGCKFLKDKPKQYDKAAASIAASLGAGFAAVATLASTLATLTAAGAKVAVIPLSGLASGLFLGLGPVIAAICNGVRLKGLIQERSKLKNEINELKAKYDSIVSRPPDMHNPLTSEERSVIERFPIELATKEIALSSQNKLILTTISKIAGAIFYAGLQVALNIATGGAPIGIMLAISVGQIAVTHIADYLVARAINSRGPKALSST